MAVALDSNVVIGFLDRGDPLHQASDTRVRELLGADEPLLASIVTYAEVLTGAKLGHDDEDIVRGFFRELISELTPIEVSVADLSAQLRGASRRLKLPDALILAGAELHPDIHLDAVVHQPSWITRTVSPGRTGQPRGRAAPLGLRCPS